MRSAWRVLVVVSLVLGLNSLAPAAEATRIGKKIANFSLTDPVGKAHALADLADSKLVVVAFLGNDCPLAKLYGPRLEKLAQEYRDKGVAVIGINSNRQDVPTRIAAYARKCEISFPVLKDPAHEVADAFGAERTPEIFVLDQDRVVRYHGRLDDQYTVGVQRPKATKNDLAGAVAELLAGKPVTTAETPVVGCIIGRAPKVEPHGDITYSKQVAAIVNKHCVECHREGELGPFPLTNYAETVGWTATIREVVADNRMPPWFADPKYGHFSNNMSLSAEDKQTLLTWIDNGAPEGNPTELPSPPQFEKGWRIGQPDAVYRLEKPYKVAADGTQDYQYFFVEPDLKEDIWIAQAEARPDNQAVVHHIVVYAVPEDQKLMAKAFITAQRAGLNLFDRKPRKQKKDDVAKPKENAANDKAENKDAAQADASKKKDDKPRDGGRSGNRRRGDNPFQEMVAIYAPGIGPWKYPDGTAMKIKKGSGFIIQMHYTPNGTDQMDQSYVGFKYAKAGEVKKRIRYGMAVNSKFEIPPHAEDHVDTASHTFDSDVLLLNLYPHMHYRGKAFRFEAIYPDQTREVLLDVPRYDFFWQLRYDLTEPKRMPKGTKIVCTAHFDNSDDNPLNPDPTQAVRFGLQSWEEMLIGYFTVVPVDEDLSKLSAAN